MPIRRVIGRVHSAEPTGPAEAPVSLSKVPQMSADQARFWRYVQDANDKGFALETMTQHVRGKWFIVFSSVRHGGHYPATGTDLVDTVIAAYDKAMATVKPQTSATTTKPKIRRIKRHGAR